MKDVEASEGWEVNNGLDFGVGATAESGSSGFGLGGGFYYNGSMAAGYGGGGGDIGMATGGSSSSSMYGSDFSVSEGAMEGLVF